MCKQTLILFACFEVAYSSVLNWLANDQKSDIKQQRKWQKEGKGPGWSVVIAELSRGISLSARFWSQVTECSLRVSLAAGLQVLPTTLYGPGRGRDIVFLLLLCPQWPNTSSKVIQTSDLAGKQLPWFNTAEEASHKVCLGQVWLHQSNLCLWFVFFLLPAPGVYTFLSSTLKSLEERDYIHRVLDKITDTLIHLMAKSGLSLQQQHRRLAQLLLILSHIRHMRWEKACG